MKKFRKIHLSRETLFKLDQRAGIDAIAPEYPSEISLTWTACNMAGTSCRISCDTQGTSAWLRCEL